MNRVHAADVLGGKGTEQDPYLITSVDDLVLFRDCVNSGESFEGKHIRQTSDLDLTEVGNWGPIGRFGSTDLFYGTYDGWGHTISHLNISNDGNNGFFGVLGGTVMNLGIESGLIMGACCGSLSSHAAGNKALIINCYSKATVNGAVRSGGIADNFDGGEIADCWYFNAEHPIPLCSYSANRILNSYCNGGIAAGTFAGVIKRCGSLDMDAASLNRVCQALNTDAVVAASECGVSFTSLMKWSTSSQGLRFDGRHEWDLGSIVHYLWSVIYLVILVVLVLVAALGIILVHRQTS